MFPVIIFQAANMDPKYVWQIKLIGYCHTLHHCLECSVFVSLYFSLSPPPVVSTQPSLMAGREIVTKCSVIVGMDTNINGE